MPLNGEHVRAAWLNGSHRRVRHRDPCVLKLGVSFRRLASQATYHLADILGARRSCSRGEREEGREGGREGEREGERGRESTSEKVRGTVGEVRDMQVRGC